MNIFIDTEFTDLLEPILISIGMVTARSDVDPVLLSYGIAKGLSEKFYAWCPVFALRMRLMSWLETVRGTDEDIDICIDYEAGWELFCPALDERVPCWIHRKWIGADISALLVYDFFRKSGLPQHHALYDARAAKYAYRPWIRENLA